MQELGTLRVVVEAGQGNYAEKGKRKEDSGSPSVELVLQMKQGIKAHLCSITL